MFCSQCGTEVLEGTSSLQLRMLENGTAVELSLSAGFYDVHSKFCSSCGSPVTPPAASLSASEQPVVTFGNEPDYLQYPETDIYEWVMNVATSNNKSGDEWDGLVGALYRQMLGGTSRWDALLELVGTDQSRMYELLTVEDVRKLELPDVLVLALHGSVFEDEGDESSAPRIEPWLDSRAWKNNPGVGKRDCGRVEFVRGFLYRWSRNEVGEHETSEGLNAESLRMGAESLRMGFGPAAVQLAVTYMYEESDLRRTVEVLMEGRDAGSAACAEWLMELECAPGEYSGEVSNRAGKSEMVFITFN